MQCCVTPSLGLHRTVFSKSHQICQDNIFISLAQCLSRISNLLTTAKCNTAQSERQNRNSEICALCVVLKGVRSQKNKINDIGIRRIKTLLWQQHLICRVSVSSGYDIASYITYFCQPIIKA